MDPTVDFLSRLADESRWTVRRGVPVFEPHTRWIVGPDGKPKQIEVTAADLPGIAAESNALERQKGVVGVLTDRHTVRPRADGSGYEPVPDVKVYGFQKNYRAGTYGPQNKPAVLADWLLYPDVATEADRRPHRSVEYDRRSNLIRGTAIMANTPFLDMGMVAFGGDGDLYLYAMGGGSFAHAPEFHDAAVAYMRSDEGYGTPYDQACEIARQRAATVSDPTAGWHMTPFYHEPAMALMLSKPGMSYDAVCKIVQAEAL